MGGGGGYIFTEEVIVRIRARKDVDERVISYDHMFTCAERRCVCTYEGRFSHVKGASHGNP